MALASDLIQVGFDSKQSDWLGDTIEFGITATGAIQSTAYAITKTINFFTTVAAGTGARLPPVASTKCTSIKIINEEGANDLQVYPATGEQIDTKAVNDAVEVVVGSARIFYKRSNTQWVSSV